MSKHWTELDPQAANEAERYSSPVPSREFLLQLLEKQGVPLSHSAVCQLLDISSEDENAWEAVSRRLKAMCRDGQLMSNRKNQFCIINKTDLVAGRVIGHRDGFGFVHPDKGGDDIFVSPRQMKGLFDGDRVLVQKMGLDQRGRPEGKVVEVLEHCTQKLVGRFSGQQGIGFLTPENQRIAHQIQIVANPDSDLLYEDQQLVVVEVVRQPTKHQLAQAVVVEVLGERMAPGMEITVALHNHDIPHVWPSEVEAEVQGLSAEVEESAKQGRVDLRHLPFVTIDGEDARDFDDAVYTEKKRGGGWRLWVAIADVSWYVRPGSELDKEAIKRGNSVYFPDFVVPMLPEVLSNGLCSLNPLVDRLAMVCEMTISAAGMMSGYRFCQAVIRSHARLTYNQVSAMLESPDTEEGAALISAHQPLQVHLNSLYELFWALRGAREQRGAIDFDTTESRILFSAERKIEQIVPVVRNDAHKIIEECMLCANVATARFLQKHKIPSLYRIHEGPKEQKLEGLRGFLGELGLSLGGGAKPEPADYQKLAELIYGRVDQHIIETMMLRSMQQATYSPDNVGHFGLAYPGYTHFTSPIRRYPDLLIHRAIRSQLLSDKRDTTLLRAEEPVNDRAFSYPYDMPQLIQLGEHCSMSERRADDATRDVVSWLKCEYMLSQVGESFEGVISAVTGFGVFVEITSMFVEGLVHITALPNDYYHFDAARQRLVGERTRQKFALGDRVRVRVVRVELDDRKIDFEMEAQLTNGARPPKVRELLAAGKVPAENKESWHNRPANADAPKKKRPHHKKKKAKPAAGKKGVKVDKDVKVAAKRRRKK